MSCSVIAPGSTIGILGGGQLGRMLAMAARRMGYRVHVYSPASGTPASQVSDLEISRPYEDLDAARAFARGVDVVTFEFENVPAVTVEAIADLVPVRPTARILHTTQNRIREKQFLQREGLPLARFHEVRTSEDLWRGIENVGCPAVLKTADSGYDGKGQAIIRQQSDVETAWQSIGQREAVLEERVDFERELSVVAARSARGEVAHFGLAENHHRNQILDFTVAPARVPRETAAEAIEITCAILQKLDVVGVICVEFFLCRDGRLLVNEIAPRPHNSGHFTLDACHTCQFEQQLRAVCGLPLGSTEQLRPAAMANLLGDLWAEGEPNWATACEHANLRLHLYGKQTPRPGRKMGHLTALGNTADEALSIALNAREKLAVRALAHAS